MNDIKQTSHKTLLLFKKTIVELSKINLYYNIIPSYEFVEESLVYFLLKTVEQKVLDILFVSKTLI